MSGLGYSLYNSKDTQKTYRGLTAQVINLFGINIRYIPKVLSEQDTDPFGGNGGFGEDTNTASNTNLNRIYGEDVNIAYEDTIPMKGLLENYDSYDGQHNLFNKFNFTMEDEITLSIEIETWRNLMSRCGYDMERPEPEDLILFDLAVAKNGKPKIFKITNCNESASFFAFGELMVFELNCTVWDYSHETLETGDPKIDGLNTIEGDSPKIGDNKDIEDKSKELINWNPNDPFSDKFSDD